MANDNKVSSFDDEISLSDLLSKLCLGRPNHYAACSGAMIGLIFILHQASYAKTPVIYYV